jgi:hypothetical protein
MAAATGANLRERMERMGHSSSRAASTYQHASREDEAIAAAMGSALAGASKKAALRVASAASLAQENRHPGFRRC